MNHDDNDIKQRLGIEVLYFHDEYINLCLCQCTALSRDIEQIHHIYYRTSYIQCKLEALPHKNISYISATDHPFNLAQQQDPRPLTVYDTYVDPLMTLKKSKQTPYSLCHQRTIHSQCALKQERWISFAPISAPSACSLGIFCRTHSNPITHGEDYILPISPAASLHT